MTALAKKMAQDDLNERQLEIINNTIAAVVWQHVRRHIKPISDQLAVLPTIRKQLEALTVQHCNRRDYAEREPVAEPDFASAGNPRPEPPDSKPGTPARSKMRRARDVVPEILAHKDDPPVELRLAGGVLCSLEPGSIALMIGGTGRGKTSLAASLLVEHTRALGSGIACSFELPARQWVARAIGTGSDESWPGVLHGNVDEQRMLEVLPEALAILDRTDASLAELRKAVRELKAAYPRKPLLAVVDYVQLAGAESDDEIRPRIGKIMRGLDAIARDEWIAMLVLSQGSRMSARALSGGEKLGVETTDTGAESAALEQWASVTIAIGQLGDVAEDGSRPVDISIGKSRMDERGDTVLPASYNGRSGLWCVTGPWRPAAEVRAERAATKRADKAADRAAGKAVRERSLVALRIARDEGACSNATLARKLECSEPTAARVTKPLRDSGLLGPSGPTGSPITESGRQRLAESERAP